MLTRKYNIYVSNDCSCFDLLGRPSYLDCGSIVIAKFSAETTCSIENRLMQRKHTLNGMYEFVEVISEEYVETYREDGCEYQPSDEDINADWEWLYGSERIIADYLAQYNC